MNKNRGALLFLAHSGMELCWLYACVAFLLAAIAQRPFPLPSALATFFLAAALNRVLQGMGLRFIAVLGLQTTGFLLTASRIVYALNYRAYPYFGKEWIVEFLGQTREFQEWLVLVIILIFVLVFWLAGVAFARRSTAYLSICTRFDYGVTAFFCIFISQSLLLVKGGIAVRNPAPLLLLFPFFAFSLLAIGLARNSDSAQRNFLWGYKGVGMLLSFTAMFLALGAGLVLFFMTYLSAAAEAGYGVLKSVAGPLLPVLERVLLFLFGQLPEQNSFFSKTIRGEPPSIPPGETSAWSQNLAWVLFGFVLLIGLIFCVLAIWHLLRWLISRTSKEEKKPVHWQLVLLWAQKLWATIVSGFKWAAQELKGCRDPVQLYRAFLKWGRRSGLPHLLNETPGEYGSRLKKQFPSLTEDIGRIVEAFNLVVYGEVNLDDGQVALVRLSWKRLRSARNWPARLKSWFFQENG
ncbi:MAG: hypothetical protein AMJ60_12350 [Desulfobacterales bacterium SG8_35]|nr:MAG: hypothetical protein AMJ60_12350 [Desulfobacterales bacterium SG8_35]